MRERRQFGKRLFDHQALAHRLADRWAETEAATALVDAACQAARGDQLPHHLVAAAKLIAAKTATAAADEAIQLFGGRGYTEDYPVERMYRDTRLARIGGGTDEMLRQIICTHLDVPDAAASLEIERYARRFG
jgi:alkylation response protein AidB-like acyl-CoA dehydrogenase